MKILLINPAYHDDILFNVKSYKIPPLGLALLASFTPKEHEVKIIDENVSKIGSIDADLVALTSMTYNSPRAYEIARHFKALGAKVVIGGIHASMMPEEASKHCDSVVIGESENIWHNIINDAENNSLKAVYYGKKHEMKDLPHPRRDLLSDKYPVQSIQTSRGCPVNCEFCSVARYNGTGYRHRPVNEVIDEIKTLKKTFLFADDNILGVGKESEDRALELFRSMKDLGKRWGSQASMNIASNDKILKSAVDSGVVGFFIGMESVNVDSLKQMGKGVNLKFGPKRYKKIKKLHDYGITATGAFVFGNDADSKMVIRNTVDFVHDADLDRTQFTIATPLPGTRLFDRISNRLIHNDYPNDWKRHDFYHATYRPQNMSIEELETGLLEAYDETAGALSILRRAAKTLFNTGSLMSSAISFYYNRDYRNAIKTNYHAYPTTTV